MGKLVKTNHTGYVIDDGTNVVINTNMGELQNYRAAVGAALRNEELEVKLDRMNGELMELKTFILQVKDKL